MTKAFNNFMTHIIDYAGMFPPANLKLIPALDNYLEYIKSEDEWIMDKFVCHIDSLSALLMDGTKTSDDYLKQFKSNTRKRSASLSILLTGSKTKDRFLDSLLQDLFVVNVFITERKAKKSAKSFEVKLPADLAGRNTSAAIKDLLESCTAFFRDAGISDYTLFIEPPVNKDYEYIFENVASALSETDLNKFGFKLRTGGVTPELFPDTRQVAFALKSCCDNKVKFKATAGLHHPVRHYNDSVSTEMHGFLNVFGAGILAHANNLSVKEIEDIIKDENPASFKFTDDEFLWNDIPANAEAVSKARNEFVLSFGSCSCDEPKEDLRNLKLL